MVHSVSVSECVRVLFVLLLLLPLPSSILELCARALHHIAFSPSVCGVQCGAVSSRSVRPATAAGISDTRCRLHACARVRERGARRITGSAIAMWCGAFCLHSVVTQVSVRLYREAA